jgi:hypothetical protein
VPENVDKCSDCAAACGMPTCSVCRLPVKGLFCSLRVMSYIHDFPIHRAFEELCEMSACAAHILLEGDPAKYVSNWLWMSLFLVMVAYVGDQNISS